MKLKSVFLAELTNEDVEKYLRNKGMIIIPVGSIEQHGRHAPLGTDVIIPQEIAKRIAIKLNAIVAPPISYGLSAAHKGFSGLAYLSAKTFITVVEDLCKSLSSVGFKRIIFLNGHYTNTAALTLACYEISEKIPNKTQIYQITYWEALTAEKLNEYLSLKAGFHANVGETSVVMAIDPNLIDLSKATEFWPKFPKFGGNPSPALTAYFETQVGANFKALPGGVWGNPKNSTTKKGEKFLKEIENAVLRLINEIELVYKNLENPDNE